MLRCLRHEFIVSELYMLNDEVNLPLDSFTRQSGASLRGASDRIADPLIHIGFHKTGSTWLQNIIFSDKARGFTSDTHEARHRLVERLVRPDVLDFDATGERNYYRKYQEAAHSSGLDLVLSHERLSGYPSSGGHDRTIIAQRLKDMFPNARILIVIREQKSLIRSMYSQHITDGGVEGLDRFLNVPEPALGRKPSFSMQFYRFDRLIHHYQQLFGKTGVLVLPFEMLRSDGQKFADRIADFCGKENVVLPENRPVNMKRPLVMQAVQRPLNAVFYHNELSPGALFHIKRFHKRYARLTPLFMAISPKFLERRLDQNMQKRIEQHVGSYFGESNARTQQLTGLSLSEFGYHVA
mgnify:FL=1